MDNDTLAAAMKAAEALPIKERRKQARGWGHAAMLLEKADALETRQEMDTALRALAAGAGAHSYPQRYHMSRARLMQKRRALLQLPEPVIAQERARTIDIEAGGAFVCDSETDLAAWPAKTSMLQFMTEQGFYYIGFGGDGGVKIRLRIHDSGPVEPQSREFRRLREATPEGRVMLRSGAVRVHGGGASAIQLPVAPGDYRVAAYGLGIGRCPECLILLSPLVGQPPAPLTDTPELLL